MTYSMCRNSSIFYTRMLIWFAANPCSQMFTLLLPLWKTNLVSFTTYILYLFIKYLFITPGKIDSIHPIIEHSYNRKIDREIQYIENRKRSLNIVINNLGQGDYGNQAVPRNYGLKGAHKIADIWTEHAYIVVGQPDPLILVFRIQREGDKSIVKTEQFVTRPPTAARRHFNV